MATAAGKKNPTVSERPPRRRTKIGTVLVSTDFSAESLKALEYAASLVRHFGGTLHVVNVHDADYAYAVPSIAVMPPLVTSGEIENYCLGELQKLSAKYRVGTSAPRLHSRTGRAFDQICKVAGEICADLIVISTHGHTGVKHLVLGSTTERVVRHAPCPVLVVRENERDFIAPGGAKPDADEPLRINKIIVPVDFSECSLHGVRYAIAFAKMCGARLSLIHAIQVQPFIPLIASPPTAASPHRA